MRSRSDPSASGWRMRRKRLWLRLRSRQARAGGMVPGRRADPAVVGMVVVIMVPAPRGVGR